jgi:hypothetical protein
MKRLVVNHKQAQHKVEKKTKQFDSFSYFFAPKEDEQKNCFDFELFGTIKY